LKIQLRKKSRKITRRITIREATAKDIDVLVKQRHAMYDAFDKYSKAEHRIGDTSYRKWALDLMKKKLFVGFLAFHGKDPVGGGCIWLRENQPRPGFPARRLPYLLSMYTKPEYRGLGIASRIVKSAMGWSNAQGFPVMSLHASKMGRPVYRRLGWERTWEMRKKLKAHRSR
jgi:GNAT superfamily N-acetyltransferase